MQMKTTPWEMIQQRDRRNLGPWGSTDYTTIVFGFGFLEDKDLSAFISEMIPGNTKREQGSETDKGKKQ